MIAAPHFIERRPYAKILRDLETEILPFSFAEYMDATGKSAKLAKNESLADFGLRGAPNFTKKCGLAQFLCLEGDADA
jgi:hypothetical protein